MGPGLPGGATDLKLERGFGLQAEVFFRRAFGLSYGGLEATPTASVLPLLPANFKGAAHCLGTCSRPDVDGHRDEVNPELKTPFALIA